MKTTKNIAEVMYKYCGLSQEKMITTLQNLDPKKYLEKIYVKKWKKEEPFYGYSYNLAEFLYFYVAPKGSVCKRMWFNKENMNQYLWVILWPDGTLVDLSISQFSETPEYAHAKPAKFKKNKPQLTTRKIAEGMGYSDDDIDIY